MFSFFLQLTLIEKFKYPSRILTKISRDTDFDSRDTFETTINLADNDNVKEIEGNSSIV